MSPRLSRLAAIVPPGEVERAAAIAEENGDTAYVIGKVKKGRKGIRIL